VARFLSRINFSIFFKPSRIIITPAFKLLSSRDAPGCVRVSGVASGRIDLPCDILETPGSFGTNELTFRACLLSQALHLHFAVKINIFRVGGGS
jgi:hypothetical protein